MPEKMPNEIWCEREHPEAIRPDKRSWILGWTEDYVSDEEKATLTKYIPSTLAKEHTKKMIDDLKIAISETVCKPICECEDVDACVSVICKIRKIIQHYEQQEENDE